MLPTSAVATWMARLMRDSSPPEATLASGCSGWPGLALTWKAMLSSPLAPTPSSARCC
jgi:hypothetical protein